MDITDDILATEIGRTGRGRRCGLEVVASSASSVWSLSLDSGETCGTLSGCPADELERAQLAGSHVRS